MFHPARDACIAERSPCCNKDWLRWYEDLLKLVTKEDARVRLLRPIPGGGAVIASGIISSIGDGHQFSNGRRFAAWLGRLVTIAIAAREGPIKRQGLSGPF